MSERLKALNISNKDDSQQKKSVRTCTHLASQSTKIRVYSWKFILVVYRKNQPKLIKTSVLGHTMLHVRLHVSIANPTKAGERIIVCVPVESY